MSAWSDVWNLITAPFGGLTGAWAAVEAFLTVVTDWHLWASLGWLLAGIALMAIGLRMWAGKSAVPSLPAVIPV